jgi:hypothetical protein
VTLLPLRKSSKFDPIVELPERKDTKDAVLSRSSASLAEGCPVHQLRKTSYKKKELDLGVSRINLNEYRSWTDLEVCPTGLGEKKKVGKIVESCSQILEGQSGGGQG